MGVAHLRLVASWKYYAAGPVGSIYQTSVQRSASLASNAHLLADACLWPLHFQGYLWHFTEQ